MYFFKNLQPFLKNPQYLFKFMFLKIYLRSNYKNMNLKKCCGLKKRTVSFKKIQIKIGEDLESWV